MNFLHSFYHQKPTRSIHLTDTAGGPLDLTERADIDAQITIALRSFQGSFYQVFDTFGREGISPYIVDEVTRLHKENDAFLGGKTVLVCNAAPRTEHTGPNGSEFYTAMLAENLQVIGPVDVFQHVRSQLTNGLYRIPNDNDIWPKGCQFRSSYVERAASNPSSFKYAPTSDVPKPEPISVGTVDRFGSLKLVDHLADRNDRLIRESIISQNGSLKGERLIGVIINDTRLDVILSLENDNLASLRRNHHLTLYSDHTRGNRLTLSWPWSEKASHKEKLENSPYSQFGSRHDIEGIPVTIG